MDAIPWAGLLEETNDSVEFSLLSSSPDQCSSLPTYVMGRFLVLHIYLHLARYFL